MESMCVEVESLGLGGGVGFAILAGKGDASSTFPFVLDAKEESGFGSELSNVVWVFVPQRAKEGRVEMVRCERER